MKENQIPQAEILLEQSSGTPDQAATEGTTSNTGDTVLLQSGQSDEASQEAAEEGTQEAGQESTEEVTSESAEDATMDIPANAESYLADIEEMVTQIQKNVQSLQQMLGMSTDSSGTEQTSESG
jgi:cell division GTPase FtsZ